MQRLRLASLGIFLALFSVDTALAGSLASIIPFDDLVPHGHPVHVSVRLITSGLPLVRRPISGERIGFYYQGRSLGQALTGGDGLAVLKFTPTEPGLHVIEARLIENPRYEAKPAQLQIACSNVSDPILLVGLASVKARPHPSSTPFEETTRSEALPNAAGILVKLAKQYLIVYLTDDESSIPDEKVWLAREKFPPSPLLAWPISGGSANSKERMMDQLRELRKSGWENISGGITRSKDLAEGLVNMKIGAIVLVEEGDETEWPVSAQKATNWNGIPSILKRKKTNPKSVEERG